MPAEPDDLLAAFFTDAPVWAQVTDLQGRLIRVSAAWAVTLGHAAGAMIGQNWTSFLSSQGCCTWEEVAPDLAATGSVSAAALEFSRKDGSVLPVGLSARFQPGVAGHPAQVLMVLQDRSEILAAEAANRAKSRFLTEISHELRSPINAMLGFAQVLKRSDLDARSQGHVAAILGSGRTVMALLTRFLDFAQIESGGIRLESRPFDLIRLLEQSALWWRQSAEGRGLSLRLDLSPGVPAHVIGDPVRLQQILDNLVGNAVKFTHAGSVTVRASLIRVAPGTARIRLAVTDTGPGLDPAQAAGMFEPFVQASGSPDRSQGWGLGLAISRRIADAMAGDLGVTSDLGRGATFYLELDLKLPQGALG